MHICSALKCEFHEAGERDRLNIAGEAGKEESSQQLFKMGYKRLRKKPHALKKNNNNQT